MKQLIDEAINNPTGAEYSRNKRNSKRKKKDFVFQTVSRDHVSRIEEKMMMNLPEVGKYYPKESLVRHRALAVEFSKVYENPWRGSYLGPKL